MPESMTSVEVQINTLTLNGFDAFDADAFSAALSGELTRLIAATPIPGAPGAGWRVNSVSIEAARGVNSAYMGTQVAQTIYAQMRGGET